MDAGRKLQAEIDQVIKDNEECVHTIGNKVQMTKLPQHHEESKNIEVSASHEQALLDARKLIDREMERFKICEKETNKAFSKEGLGQQLKTDSKEKEKLERKDSSDNVVSELQSQINNFEAEMEGRSVNKGKTRYPWLTHIETTLDRHKAYVAKLELMLRLLEGKELSPEQVNDAKDYLEDYVKSHQEDFYEFSDIDDLCNTYSLEKVKALEDLVSTTSQPGIVKLTVSSSLQNAPIQEQEETTSPVNIHNTVPRTPHPNISACSSSNPSDTLVNHTAIADSPGHLSVTPSDSAAVFDSLSTRGIFESATVIVPSSLPNLSNVTKDEEKMSFPAQKSSPTLMDAATLTRCTGRGDIPGGDVANVPLSGMALGAISLASDERLGSRGIADAAVASGRAIPSSVSGIQWMPGSPFQSENEVDGDNNHAQGTVLPITETAPDLRENFLQKLERVQQQNHRGVAGLAGGSTKPFSGQQGNLLLQQVCEGITRDIVEVDILPRMADLFVMKVEGGLGIWQAKSTVKFFPPDNFVGNIERLVGHCDGIVCILCSGYFSVLVNPWTERYCEVWLGSCVYPTIGFGGKGDNLKIVQVTDSSGMRYVNIYDVKQGMWREGPKQNQVGEILDGSGILVGDQICWQLKTLVGEFVVRYNVVNDVWDKIVALESIGNVCHLREFDGCLCATAFQEGTQTIWLLKEDRWSPLLNYEARGDVPLPLVFPVGYVDRGIVFAFKLYGSLSFYVCDALDRQPRLLLLENDVPTFEIAMMRLSATKIKNGRKIGTLKQQVESFFPMPRSVSLKHFSFHLFRQVLVE